MKDYIQKIRILHWGLSGCCHLSYGEAERVRLQTWVNNKQSGRGDFFRIQSYDQLNKASLKRNVPLIRKVIQTPGCLRMTFRKTRTRSRKRTTENGWSITLWKGCSWDSEPWDPFWWPSFHLFLSTDIFQTVTYFCCFSSPNGR